MRANRSGVHQPVNLLPQEQNEPGKPVYHVLVSLPCQTSFFHLVSIRIDCFVAVVFPVRHKIFMEKGGLKVMLVTSWSLSDSYFRFIQYHSDWFHSRLWSYRICNLFLQRFKCFLPFHFLIVVVLLHHGKKTKQLTARTVSVKVVTRLEVRVTCTLAIATGVNTVCWVPVMTLYCIENWQNSPLHFCLTTLAL